MNAIRYFNTREELMAELPGNRFVVCDIQVPEVGAYPISGETSKSLIHVLAILEVMALKGCDTQTTLVAIGGGVTGDIAGLCASLYMRGIKLIHVPTTLLAMVDSSIGGKNGVNLSIGKNLAGTTRTGDEVFVWEGFLDTLPAEEIRNGMAEVVKYLALEDCLEMQFPNRRQMIEWCQKTKLHYCTGDKRDLLNFGHTVGHAIEMASNHEVSHGLAVAIGMCAEAMIWEDGDIRAKIRDRLLREGYELGALACKWSYDDLIPYMRRDKKNSCGAIYFGMPLTSGTGGSVQVEDEMIRAFLK